MEAEADYILVKEKAIQPINDFCTYCSKIIASYLLFSSMDVTRRKWREKELIFAYGLWLYLLSGRKVWRQEQLVILPVGEWAACGAHSRRAGREWRMTGPSQLPFFPSSILCHPHSEQVFSSYFIFSGNILRQELVRVPRSCLRHFLIQPRWQSKLTWILSNKKVFVEDEEPGFWRKYFYSQVFYLWAIPLRRGY